ncbi:hypothetical protein [Lentibacillus sediminis]|uniref:hypothetical protein n=1 Tax=Lentibacillus sediminis TaxID=1940529 RepID=UPI000C1BD57D|nr:hypothetical protein [Lentibacillus sediminis]
MTEEHGQIQEKEQDKATDTLEPLDAAAGQKNEQEIDVLNLPPRKEVHGQKNSTSLKVSRPLLRFLFVVVLLLVILAGAFIVWGDEWLPLV